MDENSNHEGVLTTNTEAPAHHESKQISLPTRIEAKTSPRYTKKYEADIGNYKESLASGASYVNSHFRLISSVEELGASADETEKSSNEMPSSIRPPEATDGVKDSPEMKGDCAASSQQKKHHDGTDEGTPVKKSTHLAESDDPEVQMYIDKLMKNLEPSKGKKIDEEKDKGIKLKRAYRMLKLRKLAKKDFIDPGYDSENDGTGPPGDQQRSGGETLEAFESGLQASAEARAAASEATRSTTVLEAEFRAFQDAMMSSASARTAKRGREEQSDADTPSHGRVSKRMLLLKADRSIRTI